MTLRPPERRSTPSTMRAWLTLLVISCISSARSVHAAESRPSPWRSLPPMGAAGPCSVETWKKNWPGCEFEDGVKEGHLSLVQWGDGLGWRIAFPPGGIGPEMGGVGWRWPLPERTCRTVVLRYSVEFEPGFEFVKGGKLPGLCGGPKTITGGDTCTGYDGWSVRIMWRREGRGQAYVYHPRMSAKYGDEFDFPADFRFPIGQPVALRMAVQMNSPGRADGTLHVWATLPGSTEKLVVERSGMEWTKDSRIGVDSILFNVFHGGNDTSWAPTTPCALRIGRLAYIANAR